MAEVIGTTSAVVGLLGTAIAVVQRVQQARNTIRERSQTLENIAKQLSTLDSTLSLVKQEETLQTKSVEEQLNVIVEVGKELEIFFERLKEEQRKKRIRQFFRALESGDRDMAKQEEIYARLHRANNDLALRISVAQVGLIGNLRDGFRVAFDVLQDVNKHVRRVTGHNLELAVRIKDKQPQDDGTVPLDHADIQALGLEDNTARTEPGPNTSRTILSYNFVDGKASIMEGDVGMERCQREVSQRAQRTRIERNTFKGEVRIMTGDMSGEAAENFNENFWN